MRDSSRVLAWRRMERQESILLDAYARIIWASGVLVHGPYADVSRKADQAWWAWMWGGCASWLCMARDGTWHLASIAGQRELTAGLAEGAGIQTCNRWAFAGAVEASLLAMIMSLG